MIDKEILTWCLVGVLVFDGAVLGWITKKVVSTLKTGSLDELVSEIKRGA